MGAEKHFLGAEKHFLGAEKHFLGAEKHFLGAEKHFLGAEKHFLGAEKHFLGAEKSFLGAEKTCLALWKSPIMTQTNETNARNLVSASMLRLRMRQPFLAALALFASYKVTREVPTAATDGMTVFVNPDFWDGLSAPEQDGLLLHEVLHAALGHCTRRGVREPMMWNIAADIVINAMILAQPGGALPQGGMRNDELAQFSTEEVYELLGRDQANLPPLEMADLLEGALGDEGENESQSARTLRRVAMEGHWRAALGRAATLARAAGGSVPAGLERELDALSPGKLDWRAHLWRYLIQTPHDFAGYDRRFVGRGLYLETLEGESVRVYVCIDTSGSVGDEQMRDFGGELMGILNAYPHLKCDLYYADARLYGPHKLERGDSIPQPKGGGGTDFRPFFETVEKSRDAHETAVAIYLTDGYGAFPAQAPQINTLWVVTPGGLALESFPWGESVRMIG